MGEVMVKVNVPVDAAVAPLVSALSGIPSVVTSTSGDGVGDVTGWAYVAFHDVGGFDAEVALVRLLSRIFGEDVRTADDPFSVSLEWYSGGELPMCYLRMPAALVPAAAAVVTDWLSEESSRG